MSFLFSIHDYLKSSGLFRNENLGYNTIDKIIYIAKKLETQ